VSGVSVVIPGFNAARTLERAVASVAAQTLAPAEVIIVDDASRDGTADVARSLARQYPRLNVSLIELPVNVGPGGARNAGWDRATNTYVAFLDADDAWHPHKLAIQHGIMNANPQCALSGHRYRVDRSGSLGEIDTVAPRTVPISLRNLLVRNAFSTPSVMLRRDVTERFHPDPAVSDDYLLWMRIVSSHGPALLIDLPLTTLFKDAYGDSGLSASTRAMQRREMSAFRHLLREGRVTRATWMISSSWSVLKYFRRIVLLAVRNR
jgi:glycosyltransferase involved in cell wall biosynthesis